MIWKLHKQYCTYKAPILSFSTELNHTCTSFLPKVFLTIKTYTEELKNKVKLTLRILYGKLVVCADFCLRPKTVWLSELKTDVTVKGFFV